MITTDLPPRAPAWPAYVPPPPVRTQRQCLRAFSGPYREDERWMLENAVADLRRAHRPYLVVRETPARPDLLSIFVR